MGNPPMMTGAELILAERERQIELFGFDAKRDDNYIEGELRDAAIALAMVCDPRAGEQADGIWPWPNETWDPNEDPVRNLVVAGALIAAEIDRLRRKALRDAKPRRREIAGIAD